MDAEKMLALADGWMGEGMDLARRMLALADSLDEVRSYSYGDAADQIRQVISKEWNPLEHTR